MKPGDYEERTIRIKGKECTAKVVVSTTGVEYAIRGKSMGEGGVAPVFKAIRLKDGKVCVFKEYRFAEGDVPKQRIHRDIEKNIKRLMEEPLVDENGNRLSSFIGPMDDSLIEFPVSGGFGYIMELVDTEKFVSVYELRKKYHPDFEIRCKACINIAKFFDNVHRQGWCYKDINEGNIYINYETGDVRVIDCDNISRQSTITIIGTPGYMAPEVYRTKTPDRCTDFFSMATFFYRLFVGGYPLYGKKVEEYLMAHNLFTVGDAADVVYGEGMALFAFDPKDNSNEIRGLIDKNNPNLYRIQTENWDRLPQEIKDGFINTFSTRLSFKDRAQRTSNIKWIDIFEKVIKNKLVKCKCGKVNFGSKAASKCVFCGANLPPLKVPEQKPHRPLSLRAVEFIVRMDNGASQKNMKFEEGKLVKSIYPGLKDNWMQIKYDPVKKKLKAYNTSGLTWTVNFKTKSGEWKKAECPVGKCVILTEGIVISPLLKRVQMKVVKI